MKGNLLLHCGGREVSRDDVLSVVPPSSTETHFPVSHGEVLTTVETALNKFGFGITRDSHGLTEDDMGYFGVLNLSHPQSGAHEGVTWSVGVRNNNAKKFSAGLAVGENVTVCDNMMFSGDIKAFRKHTKNVHTEFPVIVESVMLPMFEEFIKMDERVSAYKDVDIDDRRANDIVVKAAYEDAIPPRDILHVVDEWREPEFEEFNDRTLWSLYNAFTSVHRKMKDPMRVIHRQGQLNKLFDVESGLVLPV